MLKRTLQRGFTLIELMVVVSIIGILMAAGIIAFSNAQQSARDSKRKADIDAIAKAFEQANGASGTGLYPGTTTYNTLTGLWPYFPNGALPRDPKNTGGNVYTITAAAGATSPIFCACALLEKDGTGNASSAGTGGSCAYVPGGGATADYFCASQRQ